MKMKTLIAAVVALAISGFSAQGRAAEDLPLSVTELPSALNVHAVPVNVNVGQELSDAGASMARPELIGAASVGAYLLYKGRKRRKLI
jgi:hypothetical protein